MKNLLANSLSNRNSSTDSPKNASRLLTALLSCGLPKSGINHRILSGGALLLFAASGILSAQAPKSYSQLKAEHPDWIQVPGQLIRPDCVHQVPSGARIEFGSNGEPTGDVTMKGELIAHYDACPEPAIDTRHLGSEDQHDPGPTGNGWVEASQWEVPLGGSDNIDWMSGYFQVPSFPAENGSLIYLFNGIQPTGGNWILQPVIQYGDNGAFGGDYFVVASWLVGPKGSGIVYVSTPQPASPSDVIFGITEQTGVSGAPPNQTDSYFVDGYNENTGQPSALNVNVSGLHWVWAFAGVLEAYNVTSCSQYPGWGLNHFATTQVAHGYPAFKYEKTEGFYGAQYNYGDGGGPQCNFKVSVSGNKSTLYY